MTTKQFVLSSPLPNFFSLNFYFSLHLLSMNSPVLQTYFSWCVFLQSIIYDTEKETWTDAILCQVCCNSEPSNTWSSYFSLSTVEVRNASPHPQKSRYLVLFLHIILKRSFLCWKLFCFINFTLKMETYLKNQFFFFKTSLRLFVFFWKCFKGKYKTTVGNSAFKYKQLNFITCFYLRIFSISTRCGWIYSHFLPLPCRFL